VSCQSHAASCEAIEVRGSDFLLSEAAQFPISKIVGQDQQNTGTCRGFRSIQDCSSQQLAGEPAANETQSLTQHLCNSEIPAE
jgi:hypothetical protein